jgi:hypothetical protein
MAKEKGSIPKVYAVLNKTMNIQFITCRISTNIFRTSSHSNKILSKCSLIAKAIPATIEIVVNHFFQRMKSKLHFTLK